MRRAIHYALDPERRVVVCSCREEFATPTALWNHYKSAPQEPTTAALKTTLATAQARIAELLQEIERLRTTEGLIEHNDFRAIAEANANALAAALERESRLREAMLRAMGDGIGCISPPANCSEDWPGYGSQHCWWCGARATLTWAEEKS